LEKDFFSDDDRNYLPALPQGWVWAKLDTVCNKIQDGMHFSPPIQYDQRSTGLFPYITAKNIKDSGIDLTTVTYIEEKYHQEIFKRCNPEYEDILLTKDGVKTGEVCVNHLKEEFSLLSSVALLKPKKEVINPYFLKYYLSSPFGFSMIVGQMTGVAIKRIILEKIKRSPIILPPLCEQQHIAVKIEELFSQLDAGVASLKRVQAQIKRYRQAILKAAFEGRLTQEWREEHAKKDDLSDWKTDELGNLIYVAGRIGWRGLKADEYTKTGPLFISVYNLNKGKYVDFTDSYHITQERYDESPEIQLIPDDILLVKDGSGIGKIGIVNELPQKATVNSSLLVIRAGNVFIPDFLFYLLRGPKMQRIVHERITGSATPHLFQRDIKKFDLLIPPLDEQKAIVSEIERYLSITDEIEKIIDTSLRQAESLRQSILKQAFEGKLVPQDPNDEPASILLERIKAEKARHAAGTKKGKTLQSKSPKRKIKNAN